MNITDTTTIAEIASTLPSSVRVFQRHHIDFCCGGKMPLAAACQAQGVAFAEIVDAIETSALVPEPDSRDWSSEPLAALIDHIISTYHAPLRDELPRLEAMSSKVARVHGGKAPHLTRLAAIVVEISADLQSHMQKEELVLFPAIRRMETHQLQPDLRLVAPISMMEQEHDRAGALLSELHVMTDGYVPPPWACATFRALYQGLSELESAMHVHVHLENNILFPRALALSHHLRCAASRPIEEGAYPFTSPVGRSDKLL
jgi:regulator of cell morphogenesis and NO signaling